MTVFRITSGTAGGALVDVELLEVGVALVDWLPDEEADVLGVPV